MIKIKISWIKSETDNKNFKIPENLGFNVIEIDNQEKIDNQIEKLIKQKYDTIIITKELAGFSEDIIKKYKKDKNIKIIINKNWDERKIFMNQEKLKNIIILKDLKSNIIEEAIIILKDNNSSNKKKKEEYAKIEGKNIINQYIEENNKKNKKKKYLFF